MTRSPHAASIIRIGGIFLLISATIFGWVSLPHGEETKFWKIGSYTIATVSARDDDEDDDEYDDRYRERSREGGEEDDKDDRYTIVEPSTPTKIEQEPAAMPTVSKSIAPTAVTASFDTQALSSLKLLGFSSGEAQTILGQFQGLYSDITARYPSTSGRVKVLQNLIKEATIKLNDLKTLSSPSSSSIYSSKARSIEALISLADIRISILTDIPTQTQTSVAPPTTKGNMRVTTSPTPKATIATTPTKITPTPVVQKPQPVVNTRTTAS